MTFVWQISWALLSVSNCCILLCRGITANVVLLIYYSAPLTTMKEVILTRNSASLYWPLSMMNVLNGLLWVGYGRVRMLSIIAPHAVVKRNAVCTPLTS